MKRNKEPEAIRELRQIRDEMLAEEERVGSEKFWAEVQRQGQAFARKHGLRYMETKPSVQTVREKPSRRYLPSSK